MADIRFKDLTTTASSTASDDFIAVDGTTNGTRKLNAFSPTFGGNATVTGTLTVNSTVTAANTIKYVNSGVANGTTVAPLAADIGADGTLGALQVSIGGSPSATGASRFGYVGAGDVGAWRTFIVGSNNSSGGGQVLVPSTLSSTSTSTGALVVSGGVGVAGAINTGSNVGLNTGGTSVIWGTSNTNTRITGDNGAGASSYLDLRTGGNQALYIDQNQQVQVKATTASTSTSSGALVVSGGVGVAGAIYAGGDIAIPADKGLYLKQGNVQKWTSDGTPTGTSRADIYADSGGAFFIRTGGATQALTISSSQNATFAGAIAINNTVTTGVAVASTHKVQISISGTTYYLLASNV